MFERHAELSWVHLTEWVVLNSLDLNPLDYHVWSAMLEKYHKLQPKPETIDELKVALQTMWTELLQEHINKAMANFTLAVTCGCKQWSHRASARALSISKPVSSSQHQ